MYNWSIDEEKFKKADPETYKIWRLEQLINFGLGGEKLNTEQLKKYWPLLKLDPARRKFLELIMNAD